MKVQIKGLGETGYTPDLESYELAPNAITELQNFRMNGGSAEKVGGYQQVFADTGQAVHLTSFATATQRFIVHATANEVYADADGVRTNITPATPLDAIGTRRWTGGVLSGYLFMNNGRNAPMSWDGSTSSDLTALTGWTAGDTCRAMRPVKYHLVALGITSGGVTYPHRVKWSAAAEPGSIPASWNVADPTLDAGQVDVVGDGILVDAMPLGESLVIYKERSMSLMTYIGGNDVFSFQPLPDPIGMLAEGCGCVVPGVGHVVLTAGDVVRHAGQGAASILDGKAKKWLQDQMDPDYCTASFVVANPQKSEVWVCFPERGNQLCTQALVWNWKTDTLSKRDLPSVTCGTAATFNYAVENFDSDSVTFDSESALTFAASAETFAQNDTRLLMAAGTKLYVMDSTDTAGGAAMSGYIQRTGLGLDAPERRKHLKRMFPQIDAAAGTQISVYFGASSDAETAPTWQSPVTFTVGTDQWVDSWAEGRYLAYKLASDAWFRVRSLDLEVIPGGMY